MSDCTSDPARCPICGEANACGIAAGSSSCWCFAASISGAAIAAVPSKARDKACICQACAARADGGTSNASGIGDGSESGSDSDSRNDDSGLAPPGPDLIRVRR